MNASARPAFRSAIRPLLLGVFALCSAATAEAQIYAGVQSNGGIVLSNFPSDAVHSIVVDDGTSARTPRPSFLGNDPKLAALIDKAARDTALSPGLLHAVIAVESGFDPRAVSIKGAKGLMQLMPATAGALGVSDPFDPGQNVVAGATHLRSLLDRFDNRLELALAAYNAGAEAVVKAGYQIPPYPETRAYVPKVLAHLRRIDAGAGMTQSTRPTEDRATRRVGPRSERR
jgi:soluble lytic murein transglycosylase-like protein